MFAVLQRNFPHVFGGISPGVAGLSLTYALQVSTMNNIMRLCIIVLLLINHFFASNNDYLLIIVSLSSMDLTSLEH